MKNRIQDFLFVYELRNKAIMFEDLSVLTTDPHIHIDIEGFK